MLYSARFISNDFHYQYRERSMHSFRKHRRSLLAAVALIIAQGFSTTAVHAQEKFKVVTTFTVIADIARNVAGDAATVVSITKPGAEIHEYQPTPGDILQARDAQLVLWNGLGLKASSPWASPKALTPASRIRMHGCHRPLRLSMWTTSAMR
jgi:ABC-type Zn uptake system ZnuABC Zn-binding protein ZnuA